MCVMTGQAWQFRPYMWSEPLQFMACVNGVLMCGGADG